MCWKKSCESGRLEHWQERLVLQRAWCLLAEECSTCVSLVFWWLDDWNRRFFWFSRVACFLHLLTACWIIHCHWNQDKGCARDEPYDCRAGVASLKSVTAKSCKTRKIRSGLLCFAKHFGLQIMAFEDCQLADLVFGGFRIQGDQLAEWLEWSQKDSRIELISRDSTIHNFSWEWKSLLFKWSLHAFSLLILRSHEYSSHLTRWLVRP